MSVESPAFANASSSYSAEQFRRALFSPYARTTANDPGIIAGGLLAATDLQLFAPASGMSVNVSTGECIVGGSEGGAQGGYYARAISQTNLPLAAANPTNPRIDTVCATVSDSGYTEPVGGSGDQWSLLVVAGTPTPGASLSNLLGAGSVPLSSLLLGYVLVPGGASNIVTADISNVAAVATLGVGVNLTGTAGGGLSGSYPNPTVAKVQGVAVSATAPSTGQVLTATSSGAASWATASSGGGSPTGSAGGDLSGTYPNPSVAKVNGVAVSGTPSSGQVLTATSGSAASWSSSGVAGTITTFTGSNNVVQNLTIAHGLGATPTKVSAIPLGWVGFVYENAAPNGTDIFLTCIPIDPSGGSWSFNVAVVASEFTSGNNYSVQWIART